MSQFRIEKNQFLLDEQPFKIISGAIHYFRVVPAYWEDRLKKLRAMGCNTVETYVPWNLHEPQPGEYCFSGALNLELFIQIAKNIGLYVIIRPSPFICAEWDFGGLPAWLLANDDISVRTSSDVFLSYVARYYSHLFPHLVPYQIDNEGPILLMQVENEYGAYGNDTQYLIKLRDLMHNCGATVPLITSDNFEQDLSRGICPGALPTANFGSGSLEKFTLLAEINNGGPLMCTEFWVGWYDAWGDVQHHITDADSAAKELDKVLALGNVNIYMFHGGTNFGFMNGANNRGYFAPDVTSYDYDAPLAEDGTITPKYYAFQKVIAKYVPLPNIEISSLPHGDFSAGPPDSYASLFKNLDALSSPIFLDSPCCMELLGQSYGYTLYSCTLPRDISSLSFSYARDRMLIFSGDLLVCTLFDADISGCHTLNLPAGSNLQILTENLGRVNYGSLLANQRKGLQGTVLADGLPLMGWECRTLPLTELSGLEFLEPADIHSKRSPAFFHFSVEVSKPLDTFLSLPGWGKGCVFVNGFNLGRFWDIGPQRRLYLPAPLLKKGHNDIIVLETDGIRGTSILLSKN